VTGAPEPTEPAADTEGLDYSELTTEELRDVLAEGASVEVDLGPALYVTVSLADVAVWVRMPLRGRALRELMESQPDSLRLELPELEDSVEAHDVAPGEPALLHRALEARAMLVGRPSPDND